MSQPSTDDIPRRDAKQPFVGRHIRHLTLTGPGSEKHTEHHEISLEGSGAVYRPGDALGVYPANAPGTVDRILRRLGATGDETVRVTGGETTTFRDALITRYSIAPPSRRLIELLAARGASDLEPLLRADNTAAFKHYVGGKQAYDLVDVLESHPSIAIEPQEFLATLRTLLPRLYSIASSQLVHPTSVHILVVSLTYVVRNRARIGVASTWLNDRWSLDATARMYIQDQQKHFAMPADPATALIMVGPGTGVAPFRAFLQERRALGATGRNWLFFGEQHRATNFFYEEELTAYVSDGFLRLDTAFSRDQPEKIYVQHRMRERARDLWAWLDAGAAFYVCGDKEHMAADVETELHRIVELEGGKTPEAAREFVERMKAEQRYRRDVY
jgi:sulfite reductase (NADPH) flavoprotein alpha-component